MNGLLYKSEVLNSLEINLVSTFQNIVNEYGINTDEKKGNIWITKKIKEYFGKLGNEYKYDVASSIHGGESIYDLTWYINNEENFLFETKLALETELSGRSTKHLKFDFEKLLMSNAELRLMICFNSGNKNFPYNINKLLEFYNKAICSYRNLSKGSRTLIIIWDDHGPGNIYPILMIK